MLTRHQLQLLTYLRARRSAPGEGPSFAEMAKALGLKSKGSIHRLVAALEERGHIRRLARRARAIELVDAPQDTAAALITEVLGHPAVELVEHAHPGWRARAHVLLGLKGAAACIVLALLSAQSPAHEWMPAETRWCCNDRDCRPDSRETIERTREGWLIRETGQLFRDGAFGLYPNYAPDQGEIWICQLPGEPRARCLFVLPEGS
jgi:DNA-binding MarR family transcriptional regulator